MFALLGGAGLMVGAFAPAVVVDYWGSVSLHDVAELQALLVVAAGAAAACAAPLRRPGWVVPAALLAWVGVLLPLIRNALAPEDESLFGQLGRAITDPLTREIGEVALDVTSLSWGLAPLAGGLLLVSWAALRAAR
ncbi:MAG: hypothetical protein FJ296_03800 [Planctomycetes bacterium]|nr:hypothetical protein [Planctomycetota bacterium]